MNKRIILVGPTCSGKTFLRKRFEERGFKFDVSYTTRPMRPGEVNGVDYNFISDDEFIRRISDNAFYEHVEYNGYRYGTGMYEWNNLPCFIMETAGIRHITSEDRKSCFIIYINPPMSDRFIRMRDERKWDKETIEKRLATDADKFSSFKDYDLHLTTPKF